MEKCERSVQVKFGSMSNFSHYCSYGDSQGKLEKRVKRKKWERKWNSGYSVKFFPLPSWRRHQQCEDDDGNLLGCEQVVLCVPWWKEEVIRTNIKYTNLNSLSMLSWRRKTRHAKKRTTPEADWRPPVRASFDFWWDFTQRLITVAVEKTHTSYTNSSKREEEANFWIETSLYAFKTQGIPPYHHIMTRKIFSLCASEAEKWWAHGRIKCAQASGVKSFRCSLMSSLTLSLNVQKFSNQNKKLMLCVRVSETFSAGKAF